MKEMNETIKTIQNLRTIHGQFSDRKISEEDLDLILRSAVCAANASARQSYSIIVISDKEKMKKVSEYVGDKLLVFCVDFTRIIECAKALRSLWIRDPSPRDLIAGRGMTVGEQLRMIFDLSY